MAADPDKLVLSKEEILAFCDRVLERWAQNPDRNAKNVLAMSAVRTSVAWTDEETLRAVWSEIMAWMHELMYENAMAGAARDGAAWPGTLKDARAVKGRR